MGTGEKQFSFVISERKIREKKKDFAYVVQERISKC